MVKKKKKKKEYLETKKKKIFQRKCLFSSKHEYDFGKWIRYGKGIQEKKHGERHKNYELILWIKNHESYIRFKKLKIVWYAWDKRFEAGNHKRQGCGSDLILDITSGF